MKRLVLILAMIASMGISSFANETKIAPAALNYFNNSFKSAVQVEWFAGENYYKANFVQDGQYLTAFFDANGEFLAVSRHISALQLSVELQASLKKIQGEFWITGLFEVAEETGTTYYLTLENADSRLVYKSSGSTWSQYQKLSKS